MRKKPTENTNPSGWSRKSLTRPIQFRSVLLQCVMRQHMETLIDRIVTPNEARATQSRDKTSWHALRESERLRDVELIPILESLILDEKTAKRRGAAYFILGHVAKNTERLDVAEFLIRQVSKETDKYALGSLLERIADLPKAVDMDLTPLFTAIESKEWIVRSKAIAALTYSQNPKTEKVLMSVLEKSRDKEDKLDIIAANVVLGRFGTAKALPLLQEKSKSRIRDIKDTATEAIKAIELRIKKSDLK